MSFILDALKKLDHKRQRGSVPDLLTVHDPVPPVLQEPKKRLLWPYLLLAALLLNTAILLVWLRPWRSEEPKAVAQSTVIQQHESTATESGQEVLDVHLSDSATSPTTGPGVKATEQESSPEPDSTVTTPAENTVNVVPQYQPVQAEADVHREVPGEPAPTVNQPITESQASANIGDASEQRVPYLNELPLSVQQDLPELTITGHIYSNEPTSRIVNINSRILREGEAVTAGLKVEEITRDGVIFSYKGYRFRIRGF